MAKRPLTQFQLQDLELTRLRQVAAEASRLLDAIGAEETHAIPPPPKGRLLRKRWSDERSRLYRAIKDARHTLAKALCAATVVP